MPYAWEAIERVPRALARRARSDARALRRALAGLGPVEAMQLLLSRLEKYPSNAAFLASLQGV